MRHSAILAATGFVAALVASAPAQAGDVRQEFSTAITHAGMAASAPDLNGVRMHMHHVMNCLAGPGGTGYDPAMVDPCKGQGAGLIPDAAAPKRADLTAILEKASAASVAMDYDAAKKQAGGVQDALKRAASGS